MLSLNQISKRIRTIVEAHKQIRSFYLNVNFDDFFNDQTVLYATVCLQDNAGKISPGSHSTTVNYRLYFFDLVHVASDTDLNEQEVLSDMLSVAEDIIAQLNNPVYNDWKLSADNPFQFQVKSGGDMYAGLYVDISITKIFTQNLCAVPTDLVINPTDTTMDTKVYDTIYIADGNEGNILDTSDVTKTTLNVTNGKKILLITRENAPLFKASNNPNTTEFVWDNTLITLGSTVPALPGERFLILYRNY